MAHNGFPLQINPGFVQTGRDYPFINFLKTAQSWDYGDNSGRVSPADLDDNGYPTVLNAFSGFNAGVYTVFFIPNQTSRPGNYVVRFTGEGAIKVAGTTVSNVGTGGSGRGVVTIADDNNTTQPGSISVTFSITARGASDYIRHAALIHEDDEALYDAGEVFGPDFKARLIEGGAGVLRFLDWQYINQSSISQVSQMTPEGHFSYHALWSKPGLFAGTTANSGDAFTVAAPSEWAGLTDKAVVIVKWNATATTSAVTLDVGGTGAKPVLRGDQSTAVGSSTWPSSGNFSTLIYDAGLGGWLKFGMLNESYAGLRGGVPLSVLVRLCNEVGAHPWLHVPHLALDPLTSFASDLAAYCRDNLDTGLVPRFEPANEVWNSAAGFYPTRYGWARESARGYGATDTHPWYGRVLSAMGKAISAAYGNDRSRYQVICGVQTVVGTSTSSSNERLTSARLISGGAPAGDAAKSWTTHVACAGYWNPNITSTNEQTLADEYVSATDDRKAEIIADYVTDNTLVVATTGIFTMYANWKAWAEGLGVNGLTQYEGGWSPDVSTGNTNRDTLRLDSKNSPDLVYWTLRNYNTFLATGGEYPSCLTLAGSGRTNGGQAKNIWSVLDPDIYVTPDPPQWTAFKMFKSGQRRFKVT